jgi:hypothetical protein
VIDELNEIFPVFFFLSKLCLSSNLEDKLCECMVASQITLSHGYHMQPGVVIAENSHVIVQGSIF